MTTRTRTDQRAQFLADLLTGAIEHSGYGFPLTHEWHCPDGSPHEWYARISDRYDDDDDDDDKTIHTVDLDTMARGLGIIRNAFLATCQKHGPHSLSTHYHHRDTWECLGFGGDERADLLLADRTNGDDGDYDVIGALAVLECALFGTVVYA